MLLVSRIPDQGQISTRSSLTHQALFPCPSLLSFSHSGGNPRKFYSRQRDQGLVSWDQSEAFPWRPTQMSIKPGPVRSKYLLSVHLIPAAFQPQSPRTSLSGPLPGLHHKPPDGWIGYFLPLVNLLPPVETAALGESGCNTYIISYTLCRSGTTASFLSLSSLELSKI